MTKEYEAFVAHHGIKGQQWGVRRYQNEDGSLTAEGRKRYGVSEKEIEQYRLEQNNLKTTTSLINKQASKGKEKSERRKQLEQKYLEKGLTKEQAEAEAFNRERLEKVVKTAAGVALAAALAYGTYRGAKWINKNSDKVIRKGTEISRITTDEKVNTKLPVYAAFEKGDKTIYRGQLVPNRRELERTRRFQKMVAEGAPIEETARKLKSQNIDVFNHTAQAAGKMKIAGERTGRKVFEDLLRNDKDFAKMFEESSKKYKSYTSKAKSDYDKFNIGLVFSDESSRSIANKFYSALKKKGYSGVIDVNDRTYSGYHAKKPVILFDYDKKLKNARRTVLGAEKDFVRIKDESNIQLKRVRSAARSKEYEKAIKRVGYAGASIGGALGASIAGRNAILKSNTSRQNQLIRTYKEDHPNTLLTDQQILDRIYNYKRG